MRGKLLRHFGRLYEKHVDEAKALLSRQLPSFISRDVVSQHLKAIPVFVFHDVEPERLDRQLSYLCSNGYRSLNANDLVKECDLDITKKPRVALTFDDATWTFWTYAFPLLKKYDLCATLFVIAGIVPEDDAVYPTLEDFWAGRCTQGDLAKRKRIQPLCTWKELAAMHESGIVDIQSHSTTHARIPISPVIVDFLHTNFSTYYCNLNVPISSLDNPSQPERYLRLGAPVFQSASRMLCRPRFKENPALVTAMVAYVERNGGSEFFDSPKWRKELTAKVRRWSPAQLGEFESYEAMVRAVFTEFTASRKTLEKRLCKKVRHFCYPWFVSSKLSDDLAKVAGYSTLYYGPHIRKQDYQSSSIQLKVRRIPEEYLLRLPGKGRSSICSVWAERARRQRPKGLAE